MAMDGLMPRCHGLRERPTPVCRQYTYREMGIKTKPVRTLGSEGEEVERGFPETLLTGEPLVRWRGFRGEVRKAHQIFRAGTRYRNDHIVVNEENNLHKI